MNAELTAAGGLCVPGVVPDVYDWGGSERPVRDAFVEVFDLAQQRKALAQDEHPAFDLKHYGYCQSGHGDVAARVAETRWDDGEDDYQHEWDEPIRLHYRR